MALKNLGKLVKNITENKPVHEQFLYELNDTIARLQEPHKPSKSYKPSSLGGCKRNVYFQIQGVEQDKQKVDSNLAGICEAGSDRHEKIQTWVSKMSEAGYDCEWIDVEKYLKAFPVTGTSVVKKSGMETKCYNSILNMSFLCDGIIKYLGNYYILEIKTEASFKWNGQTKPFEKHIVQATCYSCCLGIDDIIFVYENRDVCSKKAFLTHVTNEMKESLVISEINEIDEYVNTNTVPPKTDHINECKYCNYKETCKRY